LGICLGVSTVKRVIFSRTFKTCGHAVIKEASKAVQTNQIDRVDVSSYDDSLLALAQVRCDCLMKKRRRKALWA